MIDALIITATISPPGAPHRIVDQRLAEYLGALHQLREWPALPDAVIYLENSLAPDDFDDFRRLVGHPFGGMTEVIRTSMTTQDKSGSEARMLLEAWDSSEALNALGSDARVGKLTGRYHLIFPGRVRTECDISVRLTQNLTRADARFFVGSVCFWRSFLLPELVRYPPSDLSGHWLEHSLARSTHAAMSAGLSWEYPSYVGVAGRSGSSGTPLAPRGGRALRTFAYAVKKRLHRSPW